MSKYVYLTPSFRVEAAMCFSFVVSGTGFLFIVAIFLMTSSAWSTLSFATNHRKLSGINLEYYSLRVLYNYLPLDEVNIYRIWVHCQKI